MSQLPTPGSDSNNWGTMLNDFLQQALGPDGTLVTSATNPFTLTTNTNLATTSQPGLVQLAGDIANTSTSPTVVGLQGHAVSTNIPSDGEVLTWSTSGSHWLPQTPSGGGGGGGDGYYGDLDGGDSTSSYSSTAVIDCGGA